MQLFAGTGDHTLTGLCERWIMLIRLCSLKLWEEVKRGGLEITQGQCIQETAMCTNMLFQ